ncbi:MAG: hypothetical protein EHM20_06960 [Alphaproteobacteria bacterium]|nr:MAG: hypothetical protein EHM20_06960 [Alphaproteobacteria bacterium]
MRRMAKNILRNVVRNYLDRDPVTMKILSQLWDKSTEMKEALDHRDTEAFGGLIAHVWELNKTLDPGTSNNDIEAILDRISPFIYGAKLLGAGGGGFLFIVTKGIREARKVKEILTTDGGSPNPRSRFFDFDVEAGGLKVNVL